MRIGPAQTADEQAIRRLLECSGLPTADIEAPSLRHFLVTHDEERLMGVVGLDIDGDVALLRSLAVEPAARNRGIGDRLLQEAESLAHANAVRKLYLLTTTAQDYFSIRGYCAVDRATAPAGIQQTPQFRTLCPSSSILMEKIL